eukprot:gene15360-21445_t
METVLLPGWARAPLLLLVLLHHLHTSAASNDNAKPNFLVILTDDQDQLLNSMDFMPETRRLLGDAGTKFNNFVVCTSVCCPSRELGYSTYHVGKFLNKFRGNNCPRGWDVFDALVDPASNFFDVKHSVDSDRHLDLYQGLDPPSSPNKDIPLSPETPKELPKNYALWKARKAYRARAQCLAGIDELVVGLIGELRDQGVLNNTYIIFTSDNGYHIGNHMLGQGKSMPYEEDVRVPLYIRGPGIPEGQVSHYQAHMMDLPATMVELAGGIVPVEVDGISLPLPGLTTTATTLRESVLSELWRFPNPYATAKYARIGMPTELGNYRSLRVCTTYDALDRGLPGTDAPFGAGMHCYKYLLWCNSFIELFDLTEDPYEIVNLVAQAPQRLLDRFNAVISVLALCRGSTCAEPYKLMHPAGTVGGLEDAMSAEHDELYAGGSENEVDILFLRVEHFTKELS